MINDSLQKELQKELEYAKSKLKEEDNIYEAVASLILIMEERSKIVKHFIKMISNLTNIVLALAIFNLVLIVFLVYK